MNTTAFQLNIVKDYPKPGINFIDINPLLADPQHFGKVIQQFCRIIQQSLDKNTLAQTAIIAPESRGFLFAAPVANQLHLPLVLIRKEGKIPNKPYAFRVTNEYTSYNMEVDEDLLNKYHQFIYIDDILATGQTLAAVRQALGQKGKEITLSIHLTHVADLKPMRDNNKDLEGLPIEIVL